MYSTGWFTWRTAAMAIWIAIATGAIVIVVANVVTPAQVTPLQLRLALIDDMAVTDQPPANPSSTDEEACRRYAKVLNRHANNSCAALEANAALPLCNDSQEETSAAAYQACLRMRGVAD